MLERMKQSEPFIVNSNAMPNHLQLVAKDLCYEYYLTKPSDTKKREEILRKLLGTYGTYVSIQAPFSCDYGFNIHIHGIAVINFNVVMLDSSPIHIGDRAFIAPGCVLSCTGHAKYPSQRMLPAILTSAPIVLEEDVWLGSNVTVCGGVTIGKGSIIGAGSVVNKDIPAGVVAAGVPCRVIRKITEKDIIEKDTILGL